jgi:signal transduction histidine kinase
VRRDFPLSATLFILSLTVAASALIAISLTTIDVDITRSVILIAVILGTLSLALEFIDFPLLIGGDTSFSTVTYMAMVFMLPFPLAAIVGVITVLIADIRHGKQLLTMLFNASNFALTFGLTGLIWYLAFGNIAVDQAPTSPWTLLVVTLMIAAFYAINVLLTDITLALIGNRSVKHIWLTNDVPVTLPFICLEVVGVLVAVVWTTTPVLIPLLTIPAVTTYIAFEMIRRLQRQTQDAMIAMADAIDRRDPYTADHSLRVTELSVRIAEVYGMNERDIERLRIAARVHDIGKIGIGDDVLNKAGRLTDEEWAVMKGHPIISEQLLSPYRQFRHETGIVRSHHERWDGKGYPDGLVGASIPLAARIIAVADTYDAMTTSRPYRPGLSRQIAVDEIRSGALTQFDPQVVASFLQIVDEWSKIRSIGSEDQTAKEPVSAASWSSS